MAVEKIVIGRDREDIKRYGSEGTAYIGKHIVGKGEEAHLTNPIHMDLIRPHVVLVAGKRGTGKSYSAGVIAEEIAMLPKEIRENLSVIMIDTMGIYWSMKMGNEKDRELLKNWGLKPQGLPIKLYVPKGYVKDYEDVGVKVDGAFTIACSELTALDWIMTFGFSMLDPHGIAIERAIKAVTDRFGTEYSISDIIKAIEDDKRTDKSIKDALVNRFLAAEDWGLFEIHGTTVREMIEPGVISVIDVSHYMRVSAGWSVRSMIVGLLSRKIFQERLMARKAEEFEIMAGERRKTIPMVWLMMDEAHQFVGTEPTAATEPLLTLIKEGREPGISVLMITQRPGKLHEDALAQADLIIAHRLTAEADIRALRSIMQTYVLEDIQDLMNALPRLKGSALILDDNSERIYTVQVRPRFSWHAGGSPAAIKPKGIFG
ncbi:MAG: ATP-binding protein [Candidatus Aenigmatarchaeota archaeon]